MIHVVADPVAKPMTNGAHGIEAGQHAVAVLPYGQGDRHLECLFEHSHQSVEVPGVLHAVLSAEAYCPLAVEHHQLRQLLGLSGGFLVGRDCPLGRGNRHGLVPCGVRPDPAVDDGLVGCEHVAAEAEPGVQEGLVILAEPVEVLDEPKQAGTVELGQSLLHVAPCRQRRLRLRGQGAASSWTWGVRSWTSYWAGNSAHSCMALRLAQMLIAAAEQYLAEHGMPVKSDQEAA